MAHLSQRDQKMRGLVEKYTDSRLRGSVNPYSTLANSIIGQQISVKAADSIRNRIIQLCPLEAQALSKLQRQQLLRCGLSSAKTDYLLQLANWFIEGNIDIRWFAYRSPDTIRQQLLAQHGVGPWTIQMFEIFYLMRPNILPRGDIGLWQGIEKVYRVSRDQLPAKFTQLAKRWTPYSTAATWYLWRQQDDQVIHY